MLWNPAIGWWTTEMAAWFILGWTVGKSTASILFFKQPKGKHYKVLAIFVTLIVIDWTLYLTR